MTGPSTPRESSEFRAFAVTDRWTGAPVVDGIETCITVTDAARPDDAADWQPAVIRSGRTCYRVAGLPVGTHHAWARVNGDDEAPVIYLGSFPIS